MKRSVLNFRANRHIEFDIVLLYNINIKYIPLSYYKKSDDMSLYSVSVDVLKAKDMFPSSAKCSIVFKSHLLVSRLLAFF